MGARVSTNTTDQLVNIRMYMNKVKRLAKHCEMSEASAKLKAKQYVKVGNMDLAHVHVEIAIRNRHSARQYHTLVANLMPFEFELKKLLSEGGGGRGRGSISSQTQNVLQQINQLKNNDIEITKQKDEEPLSAHHISAYVQELSEEVQLDMLNRLPSSNRSD